MYLSGAIKKQCFKIWSITKSQPEPKRKHPRLAKTRQRIPVRVLLQWLVSKGFACYKSNCLSKDCCFGFECQLNKFCSRKQEISTTTKEKSWFQGNLWSPSLFSRYVSWWWFMVDNWMIQCYRQISPSLSMQDKSVWHQMVYSEKPNMVSKIEG